MAILLLTAGRACSQTVRVIRSSEDAFWQLRSDLPRAFSPEKPGGTPFLFDPDKTFQSILYIGFLHGEKGYGNHWFMYSMHDSQNHGSAVYR